MAPAGSTGTAAADGASVPPVSASVPPATADVPSASTASATAASGTGPSGLNRVASALGMTEHLLSWERPVPAVEAYETAEEPEHVADVLGGGELSGSAEGPHETSGWLSTPTWADTDLAVEDAAADLAVLTEPPGQEESAGWSRPDWADAPGWDDAPEPGADTLTHPTIDANPDRVPDEPLTRPDGSWEWNGRYLTPEESRIADAALGRCRIAEGRNVFGGYGHSGLTPAMRRIEAQLEHGQLLPDTESSALKAADSFKEKLADLIMRHPDKPAEELALEVHDGIRYAFVFDAEHYADGTLQAHSRLKGNGFDLEVRRNCWQSPEYKGINCRWRDPAHDLVFEVQFHTAASWEVSQRAHSLYEAITDAGTPPEERARLRLIYAGMSAAVPVPRGCDTIPDYRKEG